MSYHNDICLIFYPGAFLIPQRQTDKNMPLELRFGSPKSALTQPRKLSSARQPSPEQSLILHTLRAHLTQIPQSSIAPKHLLGLVSRSWDLALGLGEEIRMLGFCGVTRPTMVDDGSSNSETKIVKIRCILLGWVSNSVGGVQDGKKKGKQQPTPAPTVARVRARVNVDFVVKAAIHRNASEDPGDVKLDVDIDVSVSKAYGFSETSSASGISEAQMGHMLRKLIADGQKTVLGSGVWGTAVRELEGKVFV